MNADEPTASTAASWKPFAVQAIGTSHVKMDKPCQDAATVEIAAGGIALGALADGVGQASRSELGAKEACRAALQSMRDRAPELAAAPAPSRELLKAILSDAMQSARKAVLELAAATNLEPNDVVPTLNLVIAGNNFTATLCVGDGFVCVRSTDASEAIVLSPPEKHEFFNAVSTLLDETLSDRFHYSDQPAAFIFASSDGLLELALIEESGGIWRTHVPFFELFESLSRRFGVDLTEADFVEMLGHPEIVSRTNDDKSFIAFVRDSTDEPAATKDKPEA